MAGGGVEKFIVIKAGPSGGGDKTKSTIVGMNMDDPDSTSVIAQSAWAYAIIVGY